MAPRLPSPNDIIVLQMLVREGRLSTMNLESRLHLLETKARSTSNPGRYFLEKLLYFGWVTKERVMTGNRPTVWYVLTERGREAAAKYSTPQSPTLNGTTTVVER